jgi:hypothetical protein
VKALKIAGIVLAVYVVIVAAFETAIGWGKPDMDGALTIATRGEDGEWSERVLAGVRMDDRLYVAVNHWPRAWYWRLLADPAVEVTIGDTRAPYTAVPLDGAERDRIAAHYALPLAARALMGFAPRRFVRLDPA